MSRDSIKVLKNKIFEKSKWMQLPRDVVIGHDVLPELPAVCDDLHLGRSVLIVSGGQTKTIAGEKVRTLLAKDYSVRTYIADTISPGIIREAENEAKDVDFLIGVGGGRVIDTAKISAFNLDLPFISIPTAASHDGIASSRASIPTSEGSASLEAEPPVAIVADTGIIASAPHRL